MNAVIAASLQSRDSSQHPRTFTRFLIQDDEKPCDDAGRHRSDYLKELVVGQHVCMDAGFLGKASHAQYAAFCAIRNCSTDALRQLSDPRNDLRIGKTELLAQYGKVAPLLVGYKCADPRRTAQAAKERRGREDGKEADDVLHALRRNPAEAG